MITVTAFPNPLRIGERPLTKGARWTLQMPSCGRTSRPLHSGVDRGRWRPEYASGASPTTRPPRSGRTLGRRAGGQRDAGVWRKGHEGPSLTDLTKAMGIIRPSLYVACGDKESPFPEGPRPLRGRPIVMRACAEPNEHASRRPRPLRRHGDPRRGCTGGPAPLCATSRASSGLPCASGPVRPAVRRSADGRWDLNRSRARWPAPLVGGNAQSPAVAGPGRALCNPLRQLGLDER